MSGYGARKPEGSQNMLTVNMHKAIRALPKKYKDFCDITVYAADGSSVTLFLDVGKFAEAEAAAAAINAAIGATK
jgi:hypothetical protein